MPDATTDRRPDTSWCACCGTERPLRELLVIRDLLVAREPWYCCRASFPGPRADCLRVSAGPSSRYAIALADPSGARAR